MFSDFVNLPPDTDLSRLVAHLAERVSYAGATRVTVGPNRVAFRNAWPIFGVEAVNRSFSAFADWWTGRDPDRYALGLFSLGKLVVDADLNRMTFELGAGRFLALVTGMIGLQAAFALCFILARPAPNAVQDIGCFAFVLPVFWCLLVVPNLLISRARFRGFVDRSLASAPRRPPG